MSSPSRELSNPGPTRHASSSDLSRSEAPRKRGRKRILPVMTNSERARYYRMKDAAARAENEATVQLLQGEVDELELQERIHCQLLCLAISASTRGRIVSQLTDFFATRLAASQPTLCQVRHELEQVEVTGDTSAPVVRMDCSLRGRLVPATVRQIYPHIIGTSVLLDRLIHEDMVYACQCWFYFSPDGTLENHVVEMDGVDALHRMLGDLRTVRDVIADIGSV